MIALTVDRSLYVFRKLDLNQRPPASVPTLYQAELLRNNREDYVERIVGIEPTLTGWKPVALPLGYTRRQ